MDRCTEEDVHQLGEREAEGHTIQGGGPGEGLARWSDSHQTPGNTGTQEDA